MYKNVKKSPEYKQCVKDIKKKCLLLDVVSEYTEVRQVGDVYQGVCPFHDDNNPSFTLYHIGKRDEHYHCFGCGEHGDVIDFVMKKRGYSFEEALEYLENYSPKTKNKEVTMNKKEPDKPPKPIGKELIVNSIIQQFCHERKSLAKKFLEERGISEEAIDEFGLGYLPSEERDTLFNILEENGLDEMDLVQAGVLSYKQHYKWFKFEDRITIPFITEDGIVGFGARTTGKSAVKYINSSKTAIFSKNKLLYNIYKAKEHIIEKGFAIVVEGYFDVISLWQKGIKNVVATCGTSFSRSHAKILAEITDNVLLVFDGDAAGVKVTNTAKERLLSEGVNVAVAYLPEGEDPDTFINKTKNLEVNMNSFCGVETEITNAYISSKKEPRMKDGYLVMPRGKKKFSYLNEFANQYGKLFESAKLFGVYYLIPLNEPGKAIRLNSEDATAWLSKKVIEIFNLFPEKDFIEKIKTFLRGHASEGKFVMSLRRQCYYNGKLYIYMNDKMGRSIVIEPGKEPTIEVTPHNIRFCLNSTALELPEPDKELAGALKYLFQISVQPESDSYILKLLTWLVHGFIPTSEKKIMLISGRFATGKTVLGETLANIIDYNAAVKSTITGRSSRQLAITLSKATSVVFDNISYLTGDTCDLLSTATLGNFWKARELYTNDDEFVIPVPPHTNIIFTSTISGLSRKTDFQSRLLHIRLRPPAKDSIPPQEILDNMYPGILYDLCCIVSQILTDPEVQKEAKKYTDEWCLGIRKRKTKDDRLSFKKFIENAYRKHFLGESASSEDKDACHTDFILPEKVDKKGRYLIFNKIMRKLYEIAIGQVDVPREVLSSIGFLGVKVATGGLKGVDILDENIDVDSLFADDRFLYLTEYVGQIYGGKYEGPLHLLLKNLSEVYPNVFGKLKVNIFGNILSEWMYSAEKAGVKIEYLGRIQKDGRRGTYYRITISDKVKEEIEASKRTIDMQEISDAALIDIELAKSLEAVVEEAAEEAKKVSFKDRMNVLMKKIKESGLGKKLSELKSAVYLTCGRNAIERQLALVFIPALTAKIVGLL